MKTKSQSTFLYFAEITVNICCVSIGTGFAWSSPSLPKLSAVRDNPLPQPLESYQASLIASLLGIGAIFSPFLCFVSDKIGRKRALMLPSMITCLSFVMIAFATNVWLFYLARFLCGFAIGLYLAIAPIYVAELAEKHNRGIMSCFLKIGVTVGILLVYCVGPELSVRDTGLICLVPPVLVFVLVGAFVPESPHYLIAKGRINEARKVLEKLRGGDDVEEELDEIVGNVEESFKAKTNFAMIFKDKELFRCLLIPVGLACFQQFCGVNAILFYLQTIFDATGSNLPSETSAIIIGIVQFLSSIITPFFIDSLGRKFFLFVSGFGTLISSISLGIYFQLKSTNYPLDNINWLPITSLVVFMAAYTMGFGPLPFTILGEIFPPNVKAAAASVTISICYFSTFLVTLMFPYLQELIGIALSFWFFSVFCALSIIFTKYLVPETKQKSFVEIQKMLNILAKN